MPAMALVELACRHRYTDGFELDAAFTLDRRFTALFGPSGSGKTSLLGMIAGILQPQAGTIRLAGRTVLDTAARVCLPPEKRRVGVVFQDGLLFPHLTVQRNLRYGARLRRDGHPALDFARVLEVLEIGGLLARYPQNLSGGERQRVALGRALLSGPELLLMDEPLAALDAPLAARILAYLERIVAQWEIPTLFVTHSQADVRRAADWVVVLDRGRVVATGTPAEALARPVPLGWTNSTGPMNLLKLDRVEGAGPDLCGWIGNQALRLPASATDNSLPRFVQFSPTDVILSRQDVAGLSVRNHLRGRVCQVVAMQLAVFVAIDIGQIVWAEITAEAAAELQIAVGVDVTCLMKTHSLQLLG
jgi:molybdate transport system ATP-binding protein